MSQSKVSVYTIGIAGGSGAGKSTLASKLFDALGGSQNVTYMVHDSYYRDQSHKTMEERAQTNFDHPDALETELMVQHIRELKAGNIVQVPAYDFTTHTRIPQTKAVVLAGPRPILLIEGILILCHPELVQEMDLKVFVVSFILFQLVHYNESSYYPNESFD
jgi:uridine kinase